MNISKLQEKLIAVARRDRPADRVPYAFEKRVMALLAERAAAVRHSAWVTSLMRAAASCAMVALLFGTWTFFASSGSPASDDLSQDLQNTLLASADPTDTIDTTP